MIRNGARLVVVCITIAEPFAFVGEHFRHGIAPSWNLLADRRATWMTRVGLAVTAFAAGRVVTSGRTRALTTSEDALRIPQDNAIPSRAIGFIQ